MTRTPEPDSLLDRPLPVDRWRRLFALGVGLSLLLVLSAAALGWRENQLRRDQAATHAELVAEGVERQVRDRLLILAQALARVAEDHARAPLPQTLPAPDQLRSIGIGRLSVQPAAPLAAPLAGALPPRGLTARVLSRLRLDPPQAGVDGLPVSWEGTAGVRVVAQVDPRWFTGLLEGRSIGQDSTITLVHASQRIYARSLDNARLQGQPLRDPQLVSPAHLDSQRGHYDTVSAQDGQRKLRVYRRVADTPLTVVVSSPLGAIVGPAWGFFGVATLIAMLLALLWMGLLRAYRAVSERQGRLLVQLRATGARLERAQSLASMGTWRWHVDSSQVWWSKEVHRMYGRDSGEGPVDGEVALGYMHAEDEPRARALLQSLARSGGAMAETEFRIVRADGSVRWILAHVESEDDVHGRVLQGVQQDITELAQARDRLREAERQYRFLFEANPLPMWVFDRDTLRFLAVNQAMHEYCGYSAEDLRQARMPDIRPGADRDLVEREARLDTDLPSQGRVMTHLRKDGSRVRAAIFSHDIEFNGRPARLVAAQDVTEREADAQRFRLIARATADAVWDWDVSRGSLWWGDSFYLTFGYDRSEIAPTLESWEALVHPEDRDAVSGSLAAAAADPAVEEWEETYRFRHRDGHYLHVVDRGFVLRDGDGAALRMMGGMRDVSERREVEERMRLLGRAVEATADGLVICDARLPDYPIVYVNRAFEQMTGYSAAECIGHDCSFLQGVETDQVGLEGIRYALREKREARVLLRNYRKDGTLFWNEFYIGPVFDEHGEVTHFIGTQTDVSEHQHYQRELAHRASHDLLTGLPNRQLVQDRLQAALAQAERTGGDVAVVFIDLDDFKLVNDSLDHSAGDETLRVVASRLRALVREGDLAGRFGGDEFVMVLSEHAGETEVLALIDRITAAFAEPIHVAGLEHVLTMSIGWCRYPESGVDADSLLKRADIAMYEAKRQGRNRALCYSPGLDANVSRRLQLIGQLREALDQKQFVLAFQPIYGRGGELTALECLARWQHPQRGLLPPAEFIQVCEESGLIVELGRRTLHEAARHHALLAAAGLGHVRLAVNVSAMQFGHALEDDVAEVVRKFALPHGALELELTESVIMENADRAIDTMRRISGSGVYLAIDDFGTGYSSLAYLKRLPIDRLKIDRSFVMDLPGDRDAASICGSIIALAHSLGLRTVGEGVESEAQKAWLSSHGCDEMQGFLMARPAPFSEIMEQFGRVPAIAHG
jgi:diguanylate cyclase (GGDEF)-like protein/PAS domain S-box-containing protein